MGLTKFVCLLLIILSCNSKIVVGGLEVDNPEKKDLYTKYEIELLTEDSTVKSIIDGSVRKIYNILGDKYLVIEKDSLDFVFFNFSILDVNLSDKVFKGQKIGTVNLSENDKKYLLKLQVYLRGKPLHYCNIIQVLKNRKIRNDLIFKS